MFKFRDLFLFLLIASGSVWADTELENAARLIKAKNYPEAQGILARVVQSEPGNAEALYLTGTLQAALKSYNKAVEFADSAIKINPNKASYHVLRGRALGAIAQNVNILRGISMSGDVRAAFEKAVQLEPANRSAGMALFEYFSEVPSMAGGSTEKAKALAEKTVALDPSRGHFMLGRLLQKQKNLSAAQTEYRLATAADPKFTDVYNRLGYLEVELKQFDLAIESFRKSVELEPDNANSYDSLGDGWMAKVKLDEAINAYRKSLSLNPEVNVLLSSMRNLGKALEQAGRKDEAIAHYRLWVQLGTQKGISQAVSESKERLKALGLKD